MLYTGFSNDTVGPDGELAGKIVGFTFLVMGLPVLLIALWNQVRSMGSSRDESPAAAVDRRPRLRARAARRSASRRAGVGRASAAAASGGGDAIGRIERLQKLRESGAITDAEFDREKSKILAEQ